VRRRPYDGNEGAIGKNSNANGKDALAPATVKMVKSALDDAAVTATGKDKDTYMFGNLSLANVTLVGKVVGVKRQSSRLVYSLDDGTGVCDVIVFPGDDDGDLQEFAVNTYIRVYGNLKMLNNKDRHIAAYTPNAVRAITDFNEITFHQLEVVYATGHANQTKAAGGAVAAGNMAPMNAYSVPAAKTAVQGNVHSENIADVLAHVFHLPEALTDQGLCIDRIIELLNGKFTAEAVRMGVEEMTCQGMAYSTIDDDHFRATDA